MLPERYIERVILIYASGEYERVAYRRRRRYVTLRDELLLLR